MRVEETRCILGREIADATCPCLSYKHMQIGCLRPCGAGLSGVGSLKNVLSFKSIFKRMARHFRHIYIGNGSHRKNFRVKTKKN